MITYKKLVEKTMPQEKRASASRCVVGHYLVRPISNIISMPLIERHVDPTFVTIVSGIFPLISLFSFMFIKESIGFWIGWFSLLIWNILDGVDGNIARYNNVCSKKGELWDATVGWLARISFGIGVGFQSYYHMGRVADIINIDGYVYISMGFFSALAWIFPRLVMHKKNGLMGSESIKEVKNRSSYSIPKLIVFNVTSINGLGAVLFLFAFIINLVPIWMVLYFIISMVICFGSIFSLLR